MYIRKNALQLVNATKITYEFYEEIDPISGLHFKVLK